MNNKYQMFKEEASWFPFSMTIKYTYLDFRDTRISIWGYSNSQNHQIFIIGFLSNLGKTICH